MTVGWWQSQLHAGDGARVYARILRMLSSALYYGAGAQSDIV